MFWWLPKWAETTTSCHIKQHQPSTGRQSCHVTICGVVWFLRFISHHVTVDFTSTFSLGLEMMQSFFLFLPCCVFEATVGLPVSGLGCVWRVCCISLWKFNKAESVQKGLKTDDPHPCGFHVRSSHFFGSFEWHINSPLLSNASAKIYWTWFSLCISNCLAESRGHRRQNSSTTGKLCQLSVFTTWKTLWKMLLEREDWSSWFPSYHTGDESHTHSERHLQKCLHRYKKVLYEIFRAVSCKDLKMSGCHVRVGAWVLI